jgi:hypothetical protein
VLWIIKSCTRNDWGDVAEFNSPASNGNVIVGAISMNWQISINW